MSTELISNDKYILTRFWGGNKEGVCLQVTPSVDKYFQLNKDELKKFIKELQEAEL